MGFRRGFGRVPGSTRERESSKRVTDKYVLEANQGFQDISGGFHQKDFR